MSRPTTTKTINDLPNEIVHIIISFLSIDEAVRCGVVCKRWRHFWKHISRFHFDEDRINLSLSQFQRTVMRHHCAVDLSTCSFRHRHMSNDVNSLLPILVDKYKSLTSLTLDFVNQNISLFLMVEPKCFSNLSSLELTKYTLSDTDKYAFDACEKLKTLKLNKMHIGDGTLDYILKNCWSLENFSLVEMESVWFTKLVIRNQSLKFLELRSVVVREIDVSVEDLETLVLEDVSCRPEALRVYASRLKAFHSSCKPTTKGVLKTHDIITNCSDFIESDKINIFQHLLTLVIDLDLNNKSEANALSFVLSSCISLKTLEITIPVLKFSNSQSYSSVFQKRLREMSNFTNHLLNFATIRGYTGKKGEVEFVMHLINAYKIERITLISNYSEVTKVVVETGLLSLQEELQRNCPMLHLELEEDGKGSFILLILKHPLEEV